MPLLLGSMATVDVNIPPVILELYYKSLHVQSAPKNYSRLYLSKSKHCSVPRSQTHSFFQREWHFSRFGDIHSYSCLWSQLADVFFLININFKIETFESKYTKVSYTFDTKKACVFESPYTGKKEMAYVSKEIVLLLLYQLSWFSKLATVRSF